jgi:predicted dehydrogenase
MLRFGIIGCGGMGRLHAGLLNQTAGAHVVACADPHPEAANELARAHGIAEVFDDYRELLDLREVEAVFVTTPTFTHREIVVAAAQAGKQVFCEKPIALTVEDGQAMLDACRKARVQLEIGFVRRYDAHWGKVRELVQAGAVGRPVVWRQCNAGSCPKSPWYMDKDQGAGPLMDGAVHTYDFARAIYAAEPRAVWADMTRLRRDRTAWDTGTAAIRFASGDDLILSWSWGLPSGVGGGSILDVLGPDGVILFTAAPEELPAGCPPDQFGGVTVLRENGQKEIVPFRKNNMFADMVADYVTALAEGRPVPIPGEHGLEATRIACAVFASSEQRTCIQLP